MHHLTVRVDIWTSGINQSQNPRLVISNPSSGTTRPTEKSEPQIPTDQIPRQAFGQCGRRQAALQSFCYDIKSIALAKQPNKLLLRSPQRQFLDFILTMAKDKSLPAEDVSSKKDKKEKKDKKRKHSEVEVVAAAEEDTSVTSKKEKKDKKRKSTSGAAVDADGDVTLGDVSVVKDDEEDEKKDEAVPLGALVPFANPLCDDKSQKKVLKSVKKGTTKLTSPIPPPLIQPHY